MRAQNLARLDLRQTRISDRGLKTIARFSALRSLDLGDDGITDAGVAELVGLKQIDTLNLAGNAGVSDAAVGQLAKLSSLKTSGVAQTGITDQGVRRLLAALPGCKIVQDAN